MNILNLMPATCFKQVGTGTKTGKVVEMFKKHLCGTVSKLSCSQTRVGWGSPCCEIRECIQDITTQAQKNCKPFCKTIVARNSSLVNDCILCCFMFYTAQQQQQQQQQPEKLNFCLSALLSTLWLYFQATALAMYHNVNMILKLS